MQRARRIVSVALVAGVGMLALTGCRSQPGVAAYIGDEKITEKRVDAVQDDVKAKTSSQASSTTLAALPGRDAIVSTLVLNAVCGHLVADKGLKLATNVDVNQVAQSESVPANSVYASERAKLYSCLGGIETGATTQPTEAELRDIYNRGVAAGAIPKGQTFEEIAPQLDGDQLRSALAAKHTLSQMVASYHVTVNPRYRPLELPLLSFSGSAAAVTVPLGQPDTGAVLDLS